MELFGLTSSLEELQIPQYRCTRWEMMSYYTVSFVHNTTMMDQPGSEFPVHSSSHTTTPYATHLFRSNINLGRTKKMVSFESAFNEYQSQQPSFLVANVAPLDPFCGNTSDLDPDVQWKWIL